MKAFSYERASSLNEALEMGARPGANAPPAHAVAVAAVAVPLREPPARGRAQDADMHKKQGPSRGPGLGTGRD